MPDPFLTRIEQAAANLAAAKAELVAAIMEAHRTAHSTRQIASAAGVSASQVSIITRASA